MKFESEETRKKKKNLKEALKKLEGKYGDGIVKKDGSNPIPVFILKTTDNSFVLNNILPGKESDIREVFAIRKNKDACRVKSL